MTAVQIIQDLHRRGVQLRAEGDRLKFRPKEAVTSHLVEVLKQYKAEIIAVLTGDRVPGLCPGPEKCGGCYPVSDGRQIHPPKCSQDWFGWLARWQPVRNGRLQ